jgi:hypothetical protein
MFILCGQIVFLSCTGETPVLLPPRRAIRA